MTRKEKRRLRRLQKQKHKKRKDGYAHPGQNRHHLTPKCRNGKNDETNILWIDIEKHRAWHTLFGILTLEEVIALLKRLKEMKHRKEEEQ